MSCVSDSLRGCPLSGPQAGPGRTAHSVKRRPVGFPSVRSERGKDQAIGPRWGDAPYPRCQDQIGCVKMVTKSHQDRKSLTSRILSRQPSPCTPNSGPEKGSERRPGARFPQARERHEHFTAVPFDSTDALGPSRRPRNGPPPCRRRGRRTFWSTASAPARRRSTP